MEISKNTKTKELSLRSLALPIFFDMALKTLSVTLNVFMVAHVNVLLVGAMSAGNQVFTLFITIFSFLSIGCSVVVAQSLGAKNAILQKKF